MFARSMTMAALGIALVACGTEAPEPTLESTAATAAAIEAADGCHVGENGDDGYCTVECPCDIGEADCNSSTECLPGLRCTFNVGADHGFDPGADVCLCPGPERLGSSSYCSELCPCGEGGGDCDNDSECDTGLRCYRNVGAVYGMNEDDDVCASCLPNEANGTEDFCNADCPCEEGQGDCDSDADCAAGLRCFFNVGAEFGFDPDEDVCAACPPDSLNGGSEFCTPDCPCSHGQGDCDEDADCEAGLTCVHNVGAVFGFEPDDDVCVDLS